VDRARTDDQEETAVIREDEAADILAGLGHEFGLGLSFGKFRQQLARRRKGTGFDDIYVRCFAHRCPTLQSERWGASFRLGREGKRVEIPWVEKK